MPCPLPSTPPSTAWHLASRRWVLTTGAALLLAACGGGDSDWTHRELAARALTLDGAWSSASGMQWAASVREFDEPTGWQAFWGFPEGQAFAPVVDFATERVVGLSLGDGSGCQTLRISRVVEERDWIRVEYLYQNPRAVCALRSFQLLGLVAIPRISKPVYYVALAG